LLISRAHALAPAMSGVAETFSYVLIHILVPTGAIRCAEEHTSGRPLLLQRGSRM